MLFVIYPWRQIGRIAKKLSKAPDEKVYVFTQENREILKKYLVSRFQKVLLKDVSRKVDFIAEGASQSIRQKNLALSKLRHKTPLPRERCGKWLPLGHADSRQSLE